MLWRGLCVALCLCLLAACGGPAQPVWAPDDAVAKYTARNSGPPEIILFTVVSRQSGSGAHSGLLIAGTERVLFDPAGSFVLSMTPERNDVLYGMTDRALAVYVDYHAREAYDVIEQRLPVSMAQAQAIERRAEAYGAVPKAQCALSIGRVLTGVPGFESIPVGYFPNRLSQAFAALPGVQTRRITDGTADKSHGVKIAARR